MPEASESGTKLMMNTLRRIVWVREGDEWADEKVESLLASEERMVGPGTNTERWYLVVLKRA